MRREIPTLGPLLVVAAVLAYLPFVLSDYHIYLVAQVGVFFIAVLGLNILTGYTGQISIGHGAFMMIGGYTTAILSRDHSTNLVVTMLAAFAICFVVGLLVGLPALRLSGVYLALVTFALAVSLPYLPLQYSTFLGGSGGVNVAPTEIPSNLWVYAAAWTCVGDPLRAGVVDPARPCRARLPRGARQRDRRRRVRSRAARVQDARLRDLGRLRRRGRFAVRARG